MSKETLVRALCALAIIVSGACAAGPIPNEEVEGAMQSVTSQPDEQQGGASDSDQQAICFAKCSSDYSICMGTCGGYEDALGQYRRLFNLCSSLHASGLARDCGLYNQYAQYYSAMWNYCETGCGDAYDRCNRDCT
jgi:hypothetical protein